MGRRAQRKRSAEKSSALKARRLDGDRERLAQLVEGGSPARPIAIESSVEVDAIAAATRCPLCDRSQALVAHEAELIDGVRLRVARVSCAWCRTERPIYFALRPTPIH